MVFLGKNPQNRAGASAPASRQGILFSLSVLLLGISLLSLSVILSQQAAQEQRTTAGLASLDLTRGVYDNMQDELAVILSPSVVIGAQNGTVSINETLPFSTHIPSNLQSFEQFEGNFSDLNVSMNLTHLSNGTFVIRPANATVTQDSGDFNITPFNSSASSGTVQSYYVELVFPAGGVNSAAWQSLTTAAANYTSVHVRVRDSTYSVLLDLYENISPTATSVLNVSEGNASVANVTFLPTAALWVQTGGAIGLKTSVGFSTSEDVEADDNITVLSAANKTGNVLMG